MFQREGAERLLSHLSGKVPKGLRGEGIAVEPTFGSLLVAINGDTIIVMDLLATLITLCYWQKDFALQNMDVTPELGRLDLAVHLSSQRSNGLSAMIAKVKALSAQAVSQ